MSTRLLRFVCVGGDTTAVSYVLFLGLTGSGVHHMAAATVGWVAGLGISFVLNKRFTFGVRTPVNLREASSFVSGYLLQFLLGLAGFWVLIDQLGLTPAVAFPVNLVATTAFSFAFMRTAVFRPAPTAG
jgi:putative flippase GtrA